MNTIRCFFLGSIMLIFSATVAFGGEIQGPGKSDPAPTPTPTWITTASISDGLTQPSIDEDQIVWPDTTTMLVDFLLTIF